MADAIPVIGGSYLNIIAVAAGKLGVRP